MEELRIKIQEELEEKYDIHELLGNGAFGYVFGGIDIVTGQEVAVKAVEKKHFKKASLENIK